MDKKIKVGYSLKADTVDKLRKLAAQANRSLGKEIDHLVEQEYRRIEEGMPEPETK